MSFQEGTILSGLGKPGVYKGKGRAGQERKGIHAAEEATQDVPETTKEISEGDEEAQSKSQRRLDNSDGGVYLPPHRRQPSLMLSRLEGASTHRRNVSTSMKAIRDSIFDSEASGRFASFQRERSGSFQPSDDQGQYGSLSFNHGLENPTSVMKMARATPIDTSRSTQDVSSPRRLERQVEWQNQQIAALTRQLSEMKSMLSTPPPPSAHSQQLASATSLVPYGEVTPTPPYPGTFPGNHSLVSYGALAQNKMPPKFGIPKSIMPSGDTGMVAGGGRDVFSDEQNSPSTTRPLHEAIQMLFANVEGVVKKAKLEHIRQNTREFPITAVFELGKMHVNQKKMAIRMFDDAEDRVWLTIGIINRLMVEQVIEEPLLSHFRCEASMNFLQSWNEAHRAKRDYDRQTDISLRHTLAEERARWARIAVNAPGFSRWLREYAQALSRQIIGQIRAAFAKGSGTETEEALEAIGAAAEQALRLAVRMHMQPRDYEIRFLRSGDSWSAKSMVQRNPEYEGQYISDIRSPFCCKATVAPSVTEKDFSDGKLAQLTLIHKAQVLICDRKTNLR